MVIKTGDDFIDLLLLTVETKISEKYLGVDCNNLLADIINYVDLHVGAKSHQLPFVAYPRKTLIPSVHCVC